MVWIKCIKYFWKQYLLYFVFLTVMFFFMAEYVYYFAYSYKRLNPYGYVDESSTYKVESLVKLVSKDENSKFEHSEIEDILEPYRKNEYIDGFATAIRCPGGVINPDHGYVFQYLYYINPDADEVISLDYVYGGWFDAGSGVPEVILGNNWAEFYDAGDDITVHFVVDETGEELQCQFKVAGVLERCSSPGFIGIGRTGLPIHEENEDDAIYFCEFDFLEGKRFWYGTNMDYYYWDKIYNVLVKTDDIGGLRSEFSQYEINEISSYYVGVTKEFFTDRYVQKTFLFVILTVFGIVAVTFSTSRKLNLLYYILSLNGLSRKKFVLINSIQVFFIVILSLIPAVIAQMALYRLMFENTFLRIGILTFTVIAVELVFVAMLIAVSGKRLQVLYRESLEN